MKAQCFCRCVLASSVAGAMLAGCAGSQPPTGAPGAIAQSSRIAPRADRGQSWMLPEAKGDVLLYATGGCLGTCVFSYPNGKVVGSVTTAGQSICADVNGDVFITQSDQVVEYSHGATYPTATLSLPGLDAWGCSVDTTTGNLAVVFSGSTGNIAIFTGARGNPNIYRARVAALYCGYDNAGNLFVGGWSRVRAIRVVKRDVAPDEVLGLAGGLVRPQINLLVLERTPEPLNNLIAPGAAAIHADSDAVSLEHLDER